MSKTFRFNTFLFALIVVLGVAMMAAAVSAEKFIPIRASDIIMEYGMSIAPLSGNRIKLSANIVADDIVDTIGFSIMRIQEKQNNGTWTTKYTVSNKYGTNRISYAYSITYAGINGKQYRGYVKYYAKDGTLVETRTKTGSSVTAQN